MAEKRAEKYRVTYHGIEHEQYFRGHGIALTEYSDTATGAGMDVSEAFEDALHSLAQNGWDVAELEQRMTKDGTAPRPGQTPVVEDEDLDVYWYVSIDVKGA